MVEARGGQARGFSPTALVGHAVGDAEMPQKREATIRLGSRVSLAVYRAREEEERRLREEDQELEWQLEEEERLREEEDRRRQVSYGILVMAY